MIQANYATAVSLTATEAARQTEVSSEYQRLSANIERAHEVADSLEQILSPVLRQPSLEPGNQSKPLPPEPVLVPLADSLRGCADSLERLTAQLNRLLSSCEL